MIAELLEHMQVVTVIAPVDLAGGANSGDWIHLGGKPGFRRCCFLFAKAAGGTGGEDPIVVLQEATSAAGGGAQNLAKISKVYSKEAATSLAAVGAFSIVTQAAAVSYTEGALAEDACLLGIDISADDLSEGFEFVTVNIADVGSGNAQIGCVLAVLYDGRYMGQVAPSAIA
jgi:hypothetical protein